MGHRPPENQVWPKLPPSPPCVVPQGTDVESFLVLDTRIIQEQIMSFLSLEKMHRRMAWSSGGRSGCPPVTWLTCMNECWFSSCHWLDKTAAYHCVCWEVYCGEHYVRFPSHLRQKLCPVFHQEQNAVGLRSSLTQNLVLEAPGSLKKFFEPLTIFSVSVYIWLKIRFSHAS